jgi:hypothetical protein
MLWRYFGDITKVPRQQITLRGWKEPWAPDENADQPLCFPYGLCLDLGWVPPIFSSCIAGNQRSAPPHLTYWLPWAICLGSLKPNPSDLYLLSSWDYRYEPPHLTLHIVPKSVSWALASLPNPQLLDICNVNKLCVFQNFPYILFHFPFMLMALLSPLFPSWSVVKSY